jgi:uncharacterized protein with HEPN domain
MSERDAQLLLADILSSIEKVERYIAHCDREQFLNDEKTIDAVVRNLEIIGEATRRLSDDFTRQHASIPWPQIAGLRNRIVHEYFGLDLDIIWNIVHDDLPRLKPQVYSLINS